MPLRQLRFFSKVVASNFIDLKHPYRLNFIATYRCNLRCAMCNIWGKNTDHELSIEEIDEFFSKNNYFPWVDISGGEIFLRGDIAAIFKIVVTKCSSLCLLHYPTNGFMTRKIVSVTEDILSYFDQKLIVTISLDGPQALHDTIRGRDSSWQRSINTFKELRSLKGENLEVYFGMTLIDKNVHSFHETFEAAKTQIPGLRYEDMHFNFVHNSEHYYDYTGPSIVRNRAYQAVLEEIVSTRRGSIYPVHMLENDYLRLLNSYLQTGATPCACEALSSSCFIAPNGDVNPCSIWDAPLGNIREARFDLGKVIHSARAKELRLRIKKRECPHCWSPCEAYTAIMAHKLPSWKR